MEKKCELLAPAGGMRQFYAAVENGAEIEVFVHGALCICYSGQCQMSRFLGGRSGNRGVCAQPCRLLYDDERNEKSKNIKLVNNDYKPNDGKYVLSPKDLCTVESLGELIDAGVASLKIEGRMKSPEYVAVVVSIYKKYIDEYYEKGNYKVSDQDKEALAQIFNRGGFTEGYLYKNQGHDLMSTVIPKHCGVTIGEVLGTTKQKNLIDVKLYKELFLGDGVEIVNDCRECGILIGNLAWAEQFIDAGIKIHGDFGLNAYNDVTRELYSKMGIEMISGSLEQ